MCCFFLFFSFLLFYSLLLYLSYAVYRSIRFVCFVSFGDCIIVCEFAAKSLCRPNSEPSVRKRQSKVENKTYTHGCVYSDSVHKLSHVLRERTYRAEQVNVHVVVWMCVCSLLRIVRPATQTLVCGAYCCVRCVAHLFIASCRCVGNPSRRWWGRYVHPIRILFYDRRVIMCAVMLNSTYLLWNVLCRYFIWIVNNFTTVPFFEFQSLSLSLALSHSLPLSVVFAVQMTFFPLFPLFSSALMWHLFYVLRLSFFRPNVIAVQIQPATTTATATTAAAAAAAAFIFFFSRLLVSGSVSVCLECEFNGSVHNNSKQPTWALLRNIIAQQLCWCAARRSYAPLSPWDTHAHTHRPSGT